MNKILIVLGVLIIVGGGAFVLIKSTGSTYQATEQANEQSSIQKENGEDTVSVEGDNGIGDGSAPLDEVLATQGQTQEIIGQSTDGRDIVAYHYGTGEKEVLLIGGIHGGYSWNTALLAQQAMAYFAAGVDETVPQGVRVTIIPTLNPDGLQKVIDIDTNESFRASDVRGTDAQKVAARFNANNVDLNRNFDCNWKNTGVWQSREVSGGSAPFSEPETQAIKAYIEENTPDAAVVWYSSAGGVYASQCDGVTLEGSKELTAQYAKASGYPAYAEFDSYEVNGDMVNWFAKKGIPAISVLLTNKNDTEWNKNKKGIETVLNYVTQ